MTSISKNAYVDKLNNRVNKYNKTYHRTMKMKPFDAKKNTYIDSMGLHSNDKDPKFNVGDHVRVFKCKYVFAKEYTLNWSEEVFTIKKVKNIVPWTYVINYLNGDEIIETFYEKEPQKINQKEFRTEKVIKKKVDKLYVKWKDYNS